MLYGCPTWPVGHTSRGPSAGHGRESVKLAAEPDMTKQLASSAATAAMNAKRLKIVFPLRESEPLQSSRALRRRNPANAGCDVAVKDVERQRAVAVRRGRRLGE